jgi:hypothetical protein
MKKYQQLLLKLASKFQIKYAGTQEEEDIKNDLAAAAGWAPRFGIMNFPDQLKKDQATMTISVSKRGHTITVGAPQLNPSDVYFTYADLPNQIKAYLEKYPELFSSDAGDMDMTFTYTGV